MKAVRRHLRSIGRAGMRLCSSRSSSGAPSAAESRSSAASASVGEAADLEIANRHITTLRAAVYGATPAERAAAIKHIGRSSTRGNFVVTTRPIAEGVLVLVNDQVAFRVLAGDVDPDSTETPAGAGLRRRTTARRRASRDRGRPPCRSLAAGSRDDAARDRGTARSHSGRSPGCAAGSSREAQQALCVRRIGSRWAGPVT